MGQFFARSEAELKLYARQLGWLHSAPRAKQDADRRARLEQLKDAGAEPPLPERGAAARLLDYLFEVGPTVPGGSNPAALTHSEIRAWQANTGVRLTPWETRTLRAISRDYVSELVLGEDPDRPAPYHSTVVMDLLATEKLRRALDALDAL